MIKILENHDLTKLNTFGVSACAKFFVEMNKESDLEELFNMEEFSARGGSASGGKNIPKLFLGGGSNVLFTKDFDGIVILNKLKGIEIIKDEKDYVLIRSMGGEKWHDLVTFVINNGYWGIENLSFIPGTVGATPVQNIGAYGVEIKDTIESVEAYEIENGKKRIFTNKECEFGYRESVFKNKLKGKYFISAVVFKLSKEQNLNSNYEVLKKYLEENKIEIKTSRDVSDAIVAIRKSKLPDPIIMGNAGSFFKNIFVDIKKIEEIKIDYPDVPFFEETSFSEALEGRDRKIKIPAGWLIEKCGWKGRKIGNVGVHDKQALVLVNYGAATGKEIKDFSEQIISSVFLKFGLILEREVNLI